MKVNLFNRSSEEGVSPVVGVVIVVLITALLAGAVFVFLLDMGGDPARSSSAGVDIDIGESAATISLLTSGNSDQVFIETASGSRYPLVKVGGEVSVVAVNNESIRVIGVQDGHETLIRSVTPEESGIAQPDIIVASDGTGDYETIQAGLDAAESGDTILVKKGTYAEDVSLTTPDITLVAEHETVIENSVDGADVVSIEETATNVTVRNFVVDGDSDPSDGIEARNCISVFADNVTLDSNTFRNCTGSGASGVALYIDAIHITVLGNEMIASDIGVQIDDGAGTHEVRGNKLADNTEYNAVNTQSDPVDMQYNSWDGNPRDTSAGPIDAYPQSDSFSGGQLTSNSDRHYNSISNSESAPADNGQPVADAGADSTVYIDESASFDASGSYDPDSESLSYAWEFGDDATATGRTASHGYGTPGEYVATLTVTDASGNTATDTKTVSVTDGPPVADAGGDRTVEKGETVTFDAGGSADPDGSIVSYEWMFSDGTTKTGEIVTHSWDTVGQRTVTLTVTDDAGQTDSESATVEVVPTPVVSIPDGATATTLDTLKFSSDVTYTGDGPLNYEWTFGDGASSTQQSPTHRYTESGTYTVSLTVTDPDTLADDTASTEVTIVPPPLVARYTMDGSGTTLIDVANDNNGSISGASRFTDADGAHLSFDGNDYAYIPALNTGAASTNEFTVIAKFQITGNTGDVQQIIEHRSNAEEWFFETDVDDPSVMRAKIGGVGEMRTTLATGQTHVIAMTYDGNTMRYYANGELIDTLSGSKTVNMGRMALGADCCETDNQHLHGNIYETRLYFEALPEEKVSEATDMMNED